MVSVTVLLSGNRKSQPWKLAVSLGILCVLTGCWNDAPDPDAKRAQCAKRQYANFDPKIMKQCMDVCIACEHGTITTCSTSCTIKGAK